MKIIPWAVGILLFVHGATLGLTDDEAYYWVLAQTPALGYAYHPPAVAWSIAFFQKTLGWLFGLGSPALVRLPAAVFSALSVALAMRWLKGLGGAELSKRGAFIFISFAGIFGASWMIVPDLPLIFGWMLLFVATWEYLQKENTSRAHLGCMFVGAALLLLSKYSGVLAIGSAGLAVLLRARGSKRILGALSLVLGSSVALALILIWNAQHEWASILYQLRERHGGGGFSSIRYLRFWAVQLLLVGLPALIFSVSFVRNSLQSWRQQYLLLWMAPAFLVFCIQPAWSDFKLHWALVVWIPVFLEFAYRYGKGEWVRLARFQMAYALVLVSITVLLSHVQLFESRDPRIDVSNDMYGWDKLRVYLAENEELRNLPVLASRYQTASQAAFSLSPQRGGLNNVSLVPRDLKQKDEWPQLTNVVENEGPNWPKLLTRSLYVGDNRYNAGPEFPGAQCERIATLETYRKSLAKQILVWDCRP